jgi:probable HAF family extracellular repeat protein
MKPYSNHLAVSAAGSLAMMLGATAPKAQAASYTLTSFDASTQLSVPFGSTFVSGINNSGQVVGYVEASNNSDGFLYSGGQRSKPADQLRPAVQDRQDGNFLRGRQTDHNPHDAQVTIAFQGIGVLGRAEQRNRERR